MPEEKVTKRHNQDVSKWGFSQAIPVLPKPAADAGPRPRTRHEFNQGTGFCEICGGHNTHVRSEYCLPPPKHTAVPPVPQEAAPEVPRCTQCGKLKNDVHHTYDSGHSWHSGAEFHPFTTKYLKDLLNDNATKATAPDEAMRVARKIVKGAYALHHRPEIGNSAELEAVELAALIRQAGSERERELRELVSRAKELLEFSREAPSLTKHGTEKWWRNKEQWEAEASRLLGGEAK